LLNYVVEKLSNQPAVFLFCRSVLEGNFKSIRRLISERLPRNDAHDGRRVLDVACGPGAFSELFRPQSYYGVDINETYVRYGTRHYAGRFFRMDARALGFPGESFDDALVFGLLHHLDDDDARQVLDSLFRVMRPGARALVIEDIPTESRLNLIGHLLHRVENGHFIRPATEYRALLGGYFAIEDERIFRSGICDYYAATVVKNGQAKAGR